MPPNLLVLIGCLIDFVVQTMCISSVFVSGSLLS
jgi:hypothetical protein